MSAAEVLAQHQSYYVHGDEYDQCSGCSWKGSGAPGDPEFIAHQLDALKTAGFAVVELPPRAVNKGQRFVTFGPAVALWEGLPPNNISYSSGGQLVGPMYARLLAAGLLAAADAAEVAR